MKCGAFILLCGLLFLVGCASTPQPALKLVGKWHKVQSGDTIESVAQKYKADPEELAELNDLSGDSALASREEIFVPTPDGRLPGTGAAPPNTSRPSSKATASKNGKNGRCNPSTRICFSWPLNGPVIEGFVAGKNDGINIKAAEGESVHAAGNGTVLYASDRIKGYGNMILVRHEGNIISVYAHNKKLKVKEGAKVTTGQAIAEAGKTGAVKKPRLHFEIRLKQAPVDPLDYLPPR